MGPAVSGTARMHSQYLSVFPIVVLRQSQCNPTQTAPQPTPPHPTPHTMPPLTRHQPAPHVPISCSSRPTDRFRHPTIGSQKKERRESESCILGSGSHHNTLARQPHRLCGGKQTLQPDHARQKHGGGANDNNSLSQAVKHVNPNTHTRHRGEQGTNDVFSEGKGGYGSPLDVGSNLLPPQLLQPRGAWC